jgi:HPt (histidine-containing phosphotransfer) domain-containing protein
LNLRGLNQIVESYIGHADNADLSQMDALAGSPEVEANMGLSAEQVPAIVTDPDSGFKSSEVSALRGDVETAAGLGHLGKFESQASYASEGRFRRSAERTQVEAGRADAPIVDDSVLERLIHETGMDVAQEMLSLFLDELEVSLNAVVSAIAASDFRDVYRDLCDIRSTVKTFGFVSLYQVAEQLIKSLDASGYLSVDDGDLLQQTYMRSCLRLSEAA